MQAAAHDITGSEPDCDECRTEAITDNVSRCSDNRSKCRYGLPAGFTTTYCLHPDHRGFRTTAFPGPTKGRRKAATCQANGT
jgi:hypothetical protein